jgi:hypothetical protein
MVRGLSSNSCNRPGNTCHQSTVPMHREDFAGWSTLGVKFGEWS